jgi:hypothetical protein
MRFSQVAPEFEDFRSRLQHVQVNEVRLRLGVM